MTAAALLIAAAGIICFALATLVRHEPKAGIAMMLDLWIAAGLLRLSASFGWEPLVSSAALIGCRKLITWSLKNR